MQLTLKFTVTYAFSFFVVFNITNIYEVYYHKNLRKLFRKITLLATVCVGDNLTVIKLILIDLRVFFCYSIK